MLRNYDVAVHHADVCDDEFVKQTISRYEVTHVVHLAAQAGVRHSLKDPLSYVTSNVECFVKLLRVLDQLPVSILSA